MNTMVIDFELFAFNVKVMMTTMMMMMMTMRMKRIQKTRLMQ